MAEVQLGSKAALDDCGTDAAANPKRDPMLGERSGRRHRLQIFSTATQNSQRHLEQSGGLYSQQIAAPQADPISNARTSRARAKVRREVDVSAPAKQSRHGLMRRVSHLILPTNAPRETLAYMDALQETLISNACVLSER